MRHRGITMASRPPARRLLVVDDNHDNADSLGMLLAHYGADVRVAYDGEAALETVEAWQPQVVLLDLGMPGMDGFEVARRIRAAPRHRELTLVALTGHGGDALRTRARREGFDDHLLKPADLDALQKLVAPASPCGSSVHAVS